MNNKELPLGFGMALAQNQPAMKRFVAMTDEERQSVLQQAHCVCSQKEMQQLVSNIASGAQG